MEVDLPDVVAEVSAAFARYLKALGENDVATLHELFRDDPRTIRYGPSENLYGFDAIKAFRSARTAPGQSHQFNTVVTAFGRDFAVASTMFQRPVGSPKTGRMMQTWVRFDGRWQIVAAHVSVIEPSPN
jgi:hypothetical protein